LQGRVSGCELAGSVRWLSDSATAIALSGLFICFR
jgi:hypothetical protein